MLLDVVANVFTGSAEEGAFPHFDSFSFKSFCLVKERQVLCRGIEIWIELNSSFVMVHCLKALCVFFKDLSKSKDEKNGKEVLNLEFY